VPLVRQGGDIVLLNQSLWWIVPYALLMLFMVFAMMQFTVALLVKQPPPGPKAADRSELLERLLTLNSPENPYRLVKGKDCDLELRWNPIEASWAGRFARVKYSSVYQARMLLDDTRHELRWWEMLRTSSIFFGLDGWIPRFNWSWWIQTGYINTMWTGRAYGISPGFPPRISDVSAFEVDTVTPKTKISKVVTGSGWIFRPVLWWFQVERNEQSALQRLLPSGLKGMSARRLWGTAYAGSFLAGIVYFVVIAGPLGVSAWLWILAVSVVWWTAWGLLAWALTGFPAFWHRSA
jgi:hypothetical protein